MSKWVRRHLRFWVRTFWGTLLIGVIGLAVAVQMGRAIFPIMNEYRDVVERYLSEQLRVAIEIDSIKGEWHGLRPKLSLTHLAVRNRETAELIFEIDSVDAEVSLLSSFRDWRLAFRQLSFRGLQATLLQDAEGVWNVRSLPNSTSSTLQEGEAIIDDPLDIFLFGRRIKLIDTKLTVEFLSELQAKVTIPTIRLENDADFHRLIAEFQVDSGDQALNLVVEGLGDPRDPQDFNAKGYLELDHFPSEQVLAALGIRNDVLVKDSEMNIPEWQEHGRVNLNLWFNGTAQKGVNWKGKMEIEGVPFIPPNNVHWPKSLASQFSGHWDSQIGWQALLSKVQLTWPEYSAPMINLQALGKIGKPSRLHMDQVDLAKWHDVLQRSGLLPEAVANVLGDLRPYGTLSHLQVIQRPPEDGYFFLRAQMLQGGVHPWEGVPAIDGVNGLIESSAFDGHVVLHSDNGFLLNFPRVYHQPLEFVRARGDVRWQLNLAEKRIGISSGLLRVERDDVAANGHFNLRLPFHSSPGDEPEMTLVIGIEKGFADLHRTLVPYTVPENLYEWLGRSIKSGELRGGAFIYHGTLMSESNLTRVLQLSVRAEHAELEFDPHWPALQDASGQLLMDDQEFRVSDLRGEMLGVQVDNGDVALHHVGPQNHPAIILNCAISGASEKAMALLKASPVRQLLGDEIASWQIHGPIAGNVKLVVPLAAEDMDFGEQNIQMDLVDNNLRIPGLDLNFSDIEGTLFYSHERGVRIDKMYGTLWQRPLSVVVSTLASGKPEAEVKVTFEGEVEASRLQQWTGRPELRFLDGVSFATGEMSVPLSSSQPLRLHAQSDLRGVTVDMPAPLGKSADEPAEFSVDIDIGKGPQHRIQQNFYFDYRHSERAQAVVKQIPDRVLGVAIAIGDQISPHYREDEIWLQGDLASGQALAWYDAIENYLNYMEMDSPPILSGDQIELGGQDPFLPSDFMPVRGSLHWQSLYFDTMAFSNVTVDLEQKPDAWHFTLFGPDVAGHVSYIDDEHPLDVDLGYLHFFHGEGAMADTAAADQSRASEESPLLSIDLSSLPPAAVNIANWSVSDRDMGSVVFDLRPVSGGVAAVNLYAQIDHLDISGRSGLGGGELLWLRSDKGDTSYFSGLAKTTDINDVLAVWDMQNTMTSKSADFDVQLQWPGPPDMLALERISGLVGLKLLRGRFIRGAEVGENPLVKLIGLLNFDTMARRLRLDFSDLHPSGMGYESMRGDLLFKQGIIEVNRPLQVDMPASQLQFVGKMDIVRQQVDARLIATLPLAGNLTFAAALTGGIPMAVGVYVVGKLFKRQMDRVSSLRYHIHGDWEDPDVKLEKVFDNQTQYSAPSVDNVASTE